MSKKNLTHINTDLQRILHNLGITPDTQALFTIWEKEAGHLAKACSDICKRGQILYVEVNSPVYIQELMLRKHTIMRKINGHFAKKVIRDIKYKMPRHMLKK